MLLVGLIVAFSVVCLAYGVYEAGWLRERVLEVTIPGLPEALDGLRIGHLSDFHLGALFSRGNGASARATAWVAARRPDLVCVTGDHATPTYPDVIHSGDPVPLLISGPGVRADAVERFGELDCAAGILGQLRGPDLMPVLLNAADRPLFLGSRPTPYPGADGYPELLDPLL